MQNKYEYESGVFDNYVKGQLRNWVVGLGNISPVDHIG
jgi:hypothetical protein